MPISQDTLVRLMLGDRAKLLGYIRSIVGQEHMAEDIFQDLIVMALNKREQILDEAHLPAWLRQAAKYEALNAIRKQNRSLVMDDAVLDLLDATWQKYDPVESTDMTDALRHCLGSLTAPARQMIELRYTQGITSSQIAKQLDRKAATVYQALSRAHQMLAQCVRQRLALKGGSRD